MEAAPRPREGWTNEPVTSRILALPAWPELTWPPRGCGSALLEDRRAWGQTGSSPSSAIYQLCGESSCWSPPGSEPWLLRLVCRVCGAQQSVRPKLGGPSCEPSMPLTKALLGTAGPPSALSAPLTEGGTGDAQPGRRRLCRHVLPPLTTLALADPTLPWVPPGTSLSLSGRHDRAAARGLSRVYPWTAKSIQSSSPGRLSPRSR